jgi:hypothetical protein
MENALRIYRSIAISLACLAVFVVGMSMDLSLKHAREQLETVTASLTMHPWSPHLWPK